MFVQGLKFVLFAFLALVAPLARAQPAERWALVVGIGEYTSPQVASLANTVNDARTIAASLRNMGFAVYLLENTTKPDLDAAVERIRVEQAEAELGLFFFAGHGLQEDGYNYALPADLDPTERDFLQAQGISINALIAELRGVGVEKLVVVLDSCRNAPFAERAAYGVGLALADAPDDTIIAYSTAPGAVALDGGGVNSPFTAALASTLEGPRQDLRDILKLVRARVRLATGGSQTPWFIDNSDTEIIIQPREPVALSDATRASIGEDVSLISTAWRTIAASSDPNDFELFATLFPDNPLSQVARQQAAVLRDTGQERLPPMDLGIPDPNPAVSGSLDATITACDLLATPPQDQLGLVEPVPHDLVNTRAALRACVEAVAVSPEDPRLLGHLARVLTLEERYDEALHYFDEAVEHGNFAAYGGLVNAYRFGLGVPVDNVKAADYARTGALLGVTALRTTLAVHYRNGWGVPQSFNESRRWLELASDFGAPGATVALGDIYRRGEGVPKDPWRAMELYRRAAASGWTDAMNLVGVGYMKGEGAEKDFKQGIAWLSRASEEGNPYSAYYLGRAFRDGWGVEKDPRQAMAYFRLSAQRNFLGSYIEMGKMLEGGQGVPPDLPRAYANYLIAAEAARLIDKVESRAQAEQASAALAALRDRMSPAELAEGEKIGAEWIEQYGLLDFTRVWE